MASRFVEGPQRASDVFRCEDRDHVRLSRPEAGFAYRNLPLENLLDCRLEIGRRRRQRAPSAARILQRSVTSIASCSLESTAHHSVIATSRGYSTELGRAPGVHLRFV